MMNKKMRVTISSVALLALAGCATLPSGPSVRVLPGQGKSFEQFQVDDGVCRQWAERSIGMTPQQAVNQNVTTGAVVGTALGAGVGALLGAAAGDAAAGAAIGAGSGLLVGTASGAQAGQVYGYEAQRRYDNTYVQCMFAKGHLVPGNIRYYRVRRGAGQPPAGFNEVPPDYIPESAPPPPAGK
jgi:hypothetical protein